MEISKGRRIWECINPFVFIMVTMILASLCVTTGIMAYSRSMNESEGEMIYRVATSTIWCDLAFYIVTLLVKQKALIFDKFRYNHQKKGWPFLKLAAAAALTFVFSVAVNILIDMVGITKMFTTYSDAVNISFAGQPAAALIITVVILGPMAEELIFRWMIFGRMRFYLGSKWAIVLSSLLFGLYHMNLVQFIFCTIIGMAFSYSYEKSGNIWVPVAAHMAVNLFGVIPMLGL